MTSNVPSLDEEVHRSALWEIRLGVYCSLSGFALVLGLFIIQITQNAFMDGITIFVSFVSFLLSLVGLVLILRVPPAANPSSSQSLHTGKEEMELSLSRAAVRHSGQLAILPGPYGISSAIASRGIAIRQPSLLDEQRRSLLGSSRILPRVWVGAPLSFRLPREGETSLNLCQDWFAIDPKQDRYAVTDGVSGSFVAGQWARILSKGFVEETVELYGKEEFMRWLADCREQWLTYIKEQWIPRANERWQREAKELNSNRSYSPDWLDEELYKGAQATLIGCSIVPEAENADALSVHVLAVGDCEFFLLQPSNGKWEHIGFPYTIPSSFTSAPPNLPTNLTLQMEAWKWRKIKTFSAHPGDRLVLASDAMAKWLLTQLIEGSHRWETLLSTDLTEEAFKYLISEERECKRMEDDDVTILIIPIQGP